MSSLSTFYRIIVCALVVILLLDGCHWTLLWKASLVWVMACCRPLTRHCLNQGWPRSKSPYGISRPHWVYLLLTVIIPTVSVRKSSAMKYTIPVCMLWYIGAERKWRPFCRRYFKFLSKNEICCILIRISLKFVLRSPIANRSVLV